MKKQASSTNGQDVQLRALEREAKAQRDLLESYLAKYREANTRENIEAAPADGRIISRATVSNTPAYPKKLPIVLIATLATLLLTSGAIATGELLRMTAPRARCGFAGSRARNCAEIVLASPPEPVRAPAIAPELPVPRRRADRSSRAVLSEPRADALAWMPRRRSVKSSSWRCSGRRRRAARKVTVLGTASSESITLTALTLARLMARQAKVVVVDLAASSPTMTAASVDPVAPGLAELMQGEARLRRSSPGTGCRGFISSAPDARASTARSCNRRG